MQHIVRRTQIANWRVDDDGLLRITACVLKEGVFDYLADEVYTKMPEGVKASDKVSEFVSRDEFGPKALATLEGKPITVMTSEDNAHEWRTPDVAMSDGLTVGAVAGKPYVKDGLLLCDMVVSDKDAIESIKSGKLIEVSAGYTGELVFEPGDYEGQHYDAKQTDLVFNHVLLLPDGQARCGHDVRIINIKRGDKMGNSISMTFKNNRRKTWKFTNEEDAKVAEEMANEVKEETESISSEELTNAMTRCNELNDEIKQKNEELEEARGTIEKFKEQIDGLLNPENQEQLAQELLEQSAAEESIMEDEVEETEAADLENRRKNCKNRAERRKLLVTHVMNKRGISGVDKWDEASIDGAFAALAAVSMKNKRQVPAGLPVQAARRGNSAPASDNFSRIMASMRNRREGGK